MARAGAISNTRNVKMSDVSSLTERIRHEFASSQEKLKKFQTQQVEAHHARQQRLERLEQLLDQLREVWRPRLEALAKEFGDRVQTTPTITPSKREATFQVKSPVARVKLRFSAGAADADVTKLLLSYDLDILPILMQFERHSEVAIPLEEVQSEAVGKWFDDRIVAFVKTYLSMFENQYYTKELMVEDPIAQMQFPKFAAAATRDKGGRTHYFISEETAAEFDKQG